MKLFRVETSNERAKINNETVVYRKGYIVVAEGYNQIITSFPNKDVKDFIEIVKIELLEDNVIIL